MLKASIRSLGALAAATILAACANPGIVQISQDTYMLSRTDKSGIFGNPSAMTADVLREASEFAESEGKVAVPVTLHETPLVVGQRFASVEYQFRPVDKNDPAARRTSLVPRADVVIEKTEKVTADVKTKDPTEKSKDVYSELIKLDDLRKRGTLTDAEFQEQKRKLLEDN